ncbi:MAG TPA: hypothetical protein VN453_04655, partial [Feifaniaceae bacterium]|nr:hypothetical protein [Feifaniaceae bacterium]
PKWFVVNFPDQYEICFSASFHTSEQVIVNRSSLPTVAIAFFTSKIPSGSSVVPSDRLLRLRFLQIKAPSGSSGRGKSSFRSADFG